MLFAFFLTPKADAGFGEVKCYIVANCGNTFGGYDSGGNPSQGSQVKINPAVVPTEKGFGIEALVFKDTPDFAFVKGLGRVGAAISPSNSEETFFGPPGFENSSDFLKRKMDQEKYPNQKVTLATAVSLFEKNGSSFFSRYSLKLGLMAKYNKETTDVTPGGGLSGVLGPMYFGYSIYNDETKLMNSSYQNDNGVIKYQVHTYNIGLFLSSLILDYSNLRIQDPYPATVNLFTASLLVNRFIITASKRIEDSDRPDYDYNTQMLVNQEIKEAYFGGIQYSASDHFMFGVNYNYYLLHEFSGSVTVFF